MSSYNSIAGPFTHAVFGLQLHKRTPRTKAAVLGIAFVGCAQNRRSGELRAKRAAAARHRFRQDFAGTGFAGATAGCNSKVLFQVVKFGGAKRDSLADLAIGNRITNTNVHKKV